jgi:hypothetical protein
MGAKEKPTNENCDLRDDFHDTDIAVTDCEVNCKSVIGPYNKKFF